MFPVAFPASLDGREPEVRRHATAALLVAATLAALLPFLGKAYHIDDPLFLWVARQIRQHPLDPFGFDAIWYQTRMPVSFITKNPPLASYAIALWTAIGGWSEPWIHLLLTAPAVAVVLGARRLAGRLDADPQLAAWATLAAPGFLVSATTVMSDVPMLALLVWALALWVEGIDHDRRRRLIAAATLAGIATLTKYFAICLLPLFALYALIRRSPPVRWLPPFAAPAGLVLAYMAWTWSLYDRALFLDAAGYLSVFRAGTEGGALPRGAVGLAFAGGCAPIALLLAPVAWRRCVGLAVAAGALALALFAPMPQLARDIETAVRPTATPGLSFQFGIFLAAGIAAVALTLDELRRAPRDAAVWLLALWTAGTLAFGGFVNWSVNARSLLPLAPAVALLAGRAARRARLSPFAWSGPVALSAALALAAALGDAALANSAREAARRILADRQAGRTWFQGHWGFQYYMQEGGARPIDVRGETAAPGDRIVRPFNNTNTFPLPETPFPRESELVIPVRGPASTMQIPRGAGFYSDAWGPLPYALGSPSAERYAIHRAVPPTPNP